MQIIGGVLVLCFAAPAHASQVEANAMEDVQDSTGTVVGNLFNRVLQALPHEVNLNDATLGKGGNFAIHRHATRQSSIVKAFQRADKGSFRASGPVVSFATSRLKKMKSATAVVMDCSVPFPTAEAVRLRAPLDLIVPSQVGSGHLLGERVERQVSPNLRKRIGKLDSEDLEELHGALSERKAKEHLEKLSAMAPGDFAAIQRSDGSWRYARLRNRNDRELTLNFIVDRVGSTKEFPSKSWDQVIPLSRPEGTAARSISFPVEEALKLLKPFDLIKRKDRRRVGRRCSHEDSIQIKYHEDWGNPSEIRPGEIAAIRRSDGSWRYAKLTMKKVRQNDTILTFVVNDRRDIKKFPMESWHQVKRLVQQEPLGLTCSPKQLLASCQSLAANSPQTMMGILAPNANQGIAALKAWTSELDLPRGKLFGMDIDGEPVPPPKGPVFIKYNSKHGSAHVSRDRGNFCGVLLTTSKLPHADKSTIHTPDLKDGSFNQFGYLPLKLVEQAGSGDIPSVDK